ncbi:MAG: fatty acid desaturase family protein, partial [Deltaproteobacteria bacterium]
VAAAMTLVAYRPGIVSIVVALFVIGARQLGLSILMHEAAHLTLFKNRRINDWTANWLCAYPVWADLKPYRSYHLQHHAKNWTEDDPDLSLATPFPITRASLRRKIWRDLSGQTGWKRAKATLRRDLGTSRGGDQRLSLGEMSHRRGKGSEALRGMIITNAILLATLAMAGHAELYLLWIVSWFTTYSLVMRVRAIAEHAMAPDPGDHMLNTRTTTTTWWGRLLVAPNRVNFHLEHHLLMSVPHYNLPTMHRLLKERGALKNACVAKSYTEVLRTAASAA